ncbi:Arginyl-tRNA--protein transferase 1 [Dissophora globulifera]|nr:Arginyl-tRNA--protein transferase 1 [Dissophora globulifera]
MASCGYCGGENTAHVYGAFAYRLTCNDYQDMVDHGWRRFGLYLYKPNLRDSANNNVSSSSSSSSNNNNNHGSNSRHHNSGGGGGGGGPAAACRHKSVSPLLGGNEGSHADFIQNIHAADMDKAQDGMSWKQFKVVLEPPTFSQEKYDLYCQYQQEIHRVPTLMLNRESFDGNVTRTPLATEVTVEDQERLGFRGYGTYHQCYYVDSKLVAVAVLDILPLCVSSGYFYYDPSLSSLSLGRYSALREIALVQEIKAIPGFESMAYYTMGHYVPTAPKTHYKALFHPSYLLNPETYGWLPFEKCIHILKSKRYFSLSDSELFEPRVMGLLITMLAERRASEKSTERRSPQEVTTRGGTFPMETDTSDAELLTKPRANKAVAASEQSSGVESGFVGSDQEGHPSRKRQRQEGASMPSEDMRSGKRPSWTPPPPHSLTAGSSLPPPGMMNPDDVTEQDLSQLVVFQGDQAMKLTDFPSYRTDEAVSKAMREYYAAVGPILAPKMLIFAQ